MPDTLPNPTTRKTPVTTKSSWVMYIRSELSGVRRLIWRSASKENIVQGIKTFAWVAPLTLLIWIYAEREQYYRAPNLVLNFELRSSDPSRVVTLQSGSAIVDAHSIVDTGNLLGPRREYSGSEGQMTVELSGPKAAVEKVREQLDAAGRLKLDIDRASAPARLTSSYDTARELNRMPIFRDSGVIVTDVNPKQLYFYVDEIIEEEREVVASPSVTNLVGNPTFDPPKVSLRGPRLDIEAAGTQLQAVAELSPYTKKPGEQSQTSVAIRQPSNSRLEFKPAKVNATFVVRESDVTGTIRQMPVWVSAAPGLADKYKWEIGESGQLYNVKVVGPPDVIAALEKEQIKPRGIVFLTREDFVNSIGMPKQFPVRFDFPENVRSTVDDPKRTVTITVSERPGTEG